ncbi:hypothetical protein [Kocuria nitroreducens]
MSEPAAADGVVDGGSPTARTLHTLALAVLLVRRRRNLASH